MTISSKFPRAKPFKLAPSEVKALVRFRDGYRCRFCGMTARQHYRRYHRALEVHRLVPNARYTVKGCVTACRPCHRDRHQLLRHGGIKPPKILAFHLPEDLLGVIRGQADANDRTLTAELIRALKGYYRSQDLWPPAQERNPQ